MTATAIADRLETAWATHLTRSARPPATPHDYVYASAWRVCDRRMVYELRGEPQPAWTPEILAKFRRGDDRERDLLADLTRIGRDAEPPFSVIGQQERFTLRDHQGRPAIVGKVDARLAIDGVRAPLEVKAWSPMLVDRIERFEDLFENVWTRSGGHQILAYLLASAEPFGFLLLDRSGLPKLLPVELEPNLDRIETFLAKAEVVLDHVHAGTLPDFIDDPQECRRCDFYGAVCNPPLSARGAQVLTDPELEALLAEREALKPAGQRFNALDADVKSRLRGVEAGIAGAFSIRGRWGASSKLALPADLKARYTTVDPKGRFTLDIVRL